MSQPNPASTASSAAPRQGGLKGLLVRELPYVVLYALAVVGVAYTDVDAAASITYWQALIPVFAVIAIIAGWNRSGADARGRKTYVLKQLLHWGALFVVVWLLFLHDVQQLLNDQITGLMIIYLLGLTSFLAGVHQDWRMAIFGAFLFLSGIGIAFINDAAVAMLVLAIIALGGTLLWRKYRPRRR
ncbi:MAG: hypothetical protein U9Q81_09470 [Pseudomonadota bacterium]|nr:hypothetical protein [Pseudomonadota bacterium]